MCGQSPFRSSSKAGKAVLLHSCRFNKAPWTGCLVNITNLFFQVLEVGEGNGNPLQCSCLENPRDGGAWWAAVYGVAQSRTRLKRLSSSSKPRKGVTQSGTNSSYMQVSSSVFPMAFKCPSRLDGVRSVFSKPKTLVISGWLMSQIRRTGSSNNGSHSEPNTFSTTIGL